MIGAVVLAAGAATRFGSPKQRLLLPAVLDAVTGAAVEPVVVVVGAHAVDPDPRAIYVTCPDWQRGPGASLRCGLAVLPASVDAAVVVLADGPSLSPAAVERVVAAWREGAADVVAASYAGERGHPVVVGRAAWLEVGDEGLRSRPAFLVPCDDLGPPGDVDTVDDLL